MSTVFYAHLGRVSLISARDGSLRLTEFDVNSRMAQISHHQPVSWNKGAFSMRLDQPFGDYNLLKRLAVGGQSEVFLAIKKGPAEYSRPIVIKLLPQGDTKKASIDMFFREAFISSRFVHPNVINIHDAKIIDDEHCMFMDFIAGQTVSDIAQRGFKNQVPPSLKQVVQIIVDACDGLNYVHDFRDLDNRLYSVVHCDVSPQNLMVTYSGVTMIFDFGIAKIMWSADESTSGGKYAYMSPEQMSGGDVDPRSDIFSLGVILYELCAGYRLFRRDSPQEVIEAVLNEPIVSPRDLKPEIPPFLEQIIMRALERDPEVRYQSVLSMRDDLRQFLGMTIEGRDLRSGLGAYVASMFKNERDEIAALLNEAGDRPQPIIASTPVVAGPEASLDMEIDREDLNEQLDFHNLKTQFRLLLVITFLLLVVCAGLAFTLFA